MSDSTLSIAVQTRYISRKSDDDRFVFDVIFKIKSFANNKIRLVSRLLEITDADGHTHAIEAKGANGADPWLQYGSILTLETEVTLSSPVGCITSQFTFAHESGLEFVQTSAPHRLQKPDMVH